MRSFPHPLILLIGCILLAGVCTYIVPAGQYARVHDAATNRVTVVPGSYQKIEQAPVGFWNLMVDVPRGIETGAEVIVSILIFGGAFCVIDKTGAFRAGLLWLIARTGRAPYVVLWLVGLCFAGGGLADNMSEEIIALTPVMVFMAGRLGYSKIGAIAISVGCAVIGASFSPMNPFQVGIAQKLAEVPLLSGAWLRIIFLVPAVTFWIAWVVRYTKGVTSEGATVIALQPVAAAPAPGRIRYALILLIVLAAFILMIYGIVRLGWDFNEMTALFFIVGFVCGFIGRLGLEGTALAFAEGAKEMTLAALIVGLARSVYLVLQDGHIIDTIIHAMFTPLRHLPLFLSAAGMMLAHALIHIPVTSSSGQAQLTMPLLTPLADLTHMSRQVMVLAFQYGQGLTELFSPTNGTLMGVLAVAGVSFKDWGRFVWRPALVLFGIGLAAIATALVINY